MQFLCQNPLKSYIPPILIIILINSRKVLMPIPSVFTENHPSSRFAIHLIAPRPCIAMSCQILDEWKNVKEFLEKLDTYKKISRHSMDMIEYERRTCICMAQKQIVLNCLRPKNIAVSLPNLAANIGSTATWWKSWELMINQTCTESTSYSALSQNQRNFIQSSTNISRQIAIFIACCNNSLEAKYSYLAYKVKILVSIYK